MRKTFLLLISLMSCWIINAQNSVASGINGKILLTFQGDFSDAQKDCAKKAAEIWTQHVTLKKNLELLLKKDDLGPGTLLKTDVSYVYTGTNSCVSSAYSKGVSGSPTMGYDALVTYNSIASWSCDYLPAESQNRSDFVGETLRAIAHTLGFGSSLYKNSVKGIVFRIRTCYSPFDNLIFNQNAVYFKTLPNSGLQEQAVVDYVQGKNGAVYVGEKTAPGELYTSGVDQGTGYLGYFKTGGSLMSYDWAAGTGDPNGFIDERTLSVLEKIGWEVSHANLRIKSDQNLSSGNVSVYETSTYTAEAKDGGAISGYNWTLELVDTLGNYVSAQTAQTSSLKISSVSNPDRYRKTSNGSLEGRITLQASVNGKPARAYYVVYLSLKPLISKTVTQVTSPDYTKGTFSLNVQVYYKGADAINLSMEQEDIPDWRSYDLYQSVVAQKLVTNLFMNAKTWLYFSCKNEYGTTAYTVELPALINTVRSVSFGEKKENRSSMQMPGAVIEYADVYTMDGLFVKRISSLFNMEEELGNGQYILKIKRENSMTLEDKKIIIL